MTSEYKIDMSMVEFNRRMEKELAGCTGSDKDRIRANCIRCLYDPREPGTVLQQVDGCTMGECPTFPHRPRTGDSSRVVVPRKGNGKHDKLIRKEEKKGTDRGAIRAFCADCCYDPCPGNGSWLKQVGECEDRMCPLWGVRPVSNTH